jgi:hypothetical protein
VWAFSAVAAHYGSYYAIKYVDPVWSGVGSVVNASEVLVDNFLGLASQLPVIGGRRLVEFDPVNARHVITRHLTQADVDAMPAATRDAALAAGRALQQLPDIVNGIGGLLNSAASAIGSANVVPSQVGAELARLSDLPFLPQLLPNGTSNPLFSTLSSVTEAVEAQLRGRDGCPAWCVDMRDQAWLKDGCMCNLDRVKVGVCLWGGGPAAGGFFVGFVLGAEWLCARLRFQGEATSFQDHGCMCSPLFSTLSSVTEAVEAQLRGRDGCPAWCVDMRDQAWLKDGCMCSLDSVKVG